jgi:hypothetical protein
MRVSNDSGEIEVTVVCRGQECLGQQMTDFFKYVVPDTCDIKICIMNMGEKTIQLTAPKKNMTWVLLKGQSLNTVCSQENGEDEIEFSGYFDLLLEFHH